MPFAYNPRAPKKSTNLSINSELFDQARALKINLSAALERTLIAMLQQQQRESWLTENREAIEAYNEHIAHNGLFGDDLRNF
ncbi:MAG: type II toxin-antitoxin system CcdA family antitoxin [Pseudomonadota bacterium]